MSVRRSPRLAAARAAARTPAPPMAFRGWFGGYWHVYDNDGSYNGFFSWVPRYLRVGPASPLAYAFIVAWLWAMCAYKPPLDFEVALPSLYSRPWWVHVLTVCWTLAITVRICRQPGGAGTLFAFTMWSWVLLMLRSGWLVLAPLIGADARWRLAWAAEALRFPVAAGAWITFSVWNLLLFPLIGTFAFKEPAARKKFIVWCFSPNMASIHLCNLPLAAAGTMLGGRAGGVRALGEADLWAGLCVAACYAAVYLLLLDRLGVHLYPIFSPRTHACALAYSALLALYALTFRGFNALLPRLEGVWP